MLHTEFEQQMDRLVSFKKMDSHLMAAYWEAMESWDVRDLAYAITVILQHDDKFPRLGRFREMVAEKHRGDKRESNLDLFAFFLCQKCGDEFIVRTDELTTKPGNRHCESCRVYHARSISWNSELMLKLWKQRTSDQQIAVLP